jgi:hypothetical protein
MSDRHPLEGVLRSYLDGELGVLARWRCAGHLKRCERCRIALREEERLRLRAASLLDQLELAVDVNEAWRRLRVLGGRAVPEPAAVSRLLAWGGGTALALGFFVLLRAREEPRATSTAPLTPELAAVDRCCWDLDGGGTPDDGVLALALPGQRVVALTVYEDGNRSRGLSSADVIRFGLRVASRPEERTGGAGPDASGVALPPAVRDVCCADYDGGGRRDDGILTIYGEIDDLERVVLYEDEDGSRTFTDGDRLRWSGGRRPVAPWPVATGL